MLAADVAGQERARNALSRAIASGRVAHAMLFAGPEGVGKRRFADAFARALLCRQSGEGRGDPGLAGECGSCVACQLPLEAHPGFRVLSAESGSLIEIGAIRTAIAELSLRSGDRRIVVVDGADAMGEPAANAFLKTLEEPPPGIVFLLVTARPAHLLETIHSRTQRVPFSVLSADEFATAMAPHAVDTSESIDALFVTSGGSPGVAMRLLTGIEGCGGRERFEELLDGVGAERPSGLIDYLPALPKETARARLHRLLELIQFGLWGRRNEDAAGRIDLGERALLVGELMRGLTGGRSTELTLEVLGRVLRGGETRAIRAGLPKSFFASH